MPSDFLNLSSEPEASASTQILSPGKPKVNKSSGLLRQLRPEPLGVGLRCEYFPKLLTQLLRFGYHSLVLGVSDGSLSIQGSDPATTINRLNLAPCLCLQIKFYWNTAILMFFVVAAYCHSGMGSRPEISTIWTLKKCFYSSEIGSHSGC